MEEEWMVRAIPSSVLLASAARLRSKASASACSFLIVDDFLIAESNTEITDATLTKLKEQSEELFVQKTPDSFSGYELARDRKTRAITLSMPQKIIEATRTHLPDALDGESKVKVLKGGKLADVADGLELDPDTKESKKLDAKQKTTQSIIGSLKFVEKIMPEISVALHRLSCVMSAPPVEALAVAKGVLYYAYLHKNNGITFGGAYEDDEYKEEHLMSALRVGHRSKIFVGISGRHMGRRP